LKVISEITKYPVEMLDMNMEMEADLGIDTVKQATIFSILGENLTWGIKRKHIPIQDYRLYCRPCKPKRRERVERNCRLGGETYSSNVVQ